MCGSVNLWCRNDPITDGAYGEAHGDPGADAKGSCAGYGGRVTDEVSNDYMDKAPAVKGWRVCRMHGARGGAPEGERNGNYRHRARTKEAFEPVKLIREDNESSSLTEQLPIFCVGLVLIWLHTPPID
jgi:hypothetical protein